MLTKLSNGTYVDPYEVSWVGHPTDEYADTKPLAAVISGYLVYFDVEEDAKVFLAFIEEFAEKERVTEEKYQAEEVIRVAEWKAKKEADNASS